MVSELAKRSATLREMSPWPDINYMVDESCARVYPYGQTGKAGDEIAVSLRITNHAPETMTYRMKWNLPRGWKQISGGSSVTIAAREEGEVTAKFRTAGAGLHVISADVTFGSWEWPGWSEALVRLE